MKQQNSLACGHLGVIDCSYPACFYLMISGPTYSSGIPPFDYPYGQADTRTELEGFAMTSEYVGQFIIYDDLYFDNNWAISANMCYVTQTR